MKVIEVFPAAIVTVAGTDAAVASELVSVTTNPPVGAGPEIDTVPVTAVVALPTTEVGETLTETKVGGCTVRVAFCDPPLQVAVTVAVTAAFTAVVLIANVAVVEPAEMITPAGTLTEVELDASLTAAPAPPAGAFKVMVPVAPLPPTTLEGAIVKVDI